jgi:hypothetical protein
MQVILNYFAFFLIYFSLQVLLYRFFKININKFLIVLFIIGVSVVVGFYSYSIELLMNLININLMIICFWFLMPGIINHGPATEIIHLIAYKKINKKKKLEKYFLKSKVGKAVEKRLEINISSNLIKLNKGGFFVKKNAEKILIFLNLIKKVYRLKSDAY